MHYQAGSHKSVEKALIILSAFKSRNQELGIFELSRMLSLHRSTVSRLIKVLVAHDFLQQNTQTKKFSLGASIMELANSLKKSLKTDLVQIAKPYLDDLRDRLEETVILETLSGKNWIEIHVVEGPGRIRLVAEIGERMPIHITAGGKAFLAFSEPDIRAYLLEGKLIRITKNSITDKRKLECHFDEIRKQGFAFDRAEYDDGIHAVSVPVFNSEDAPLACVTVAGTPQKITGREDSIVVLELKKTAKEISGRFGYKGG
ncbi:MAG: IclR family transcriptional regulator [Deltaproteobacteria bacterium]|nr:IclR family transcriptional regulator [Deltaproteobacteria bacterium]